MTATASPMSNRIRLACHLRTAIDAGWQIACTSPGVVDGPRAAIESLQWIAIEHATTVAAALRSNGAWSFEGPARRFDAEEWWYRVHLASARPHASHRLVLGFDGLATLADVWLDDRLILSSDNMFVAHTVDLPTEFAAAELVIRFRSLDAALSARKPRPRWRAPMIEHQQLRWLRTSVLGRTPGWSPPAAAVGPWRPVWMEERRQLDLQEPRLSATLVEGQGLVSFACKLQCLDDITVREVRLVVERDGRRHEVVASNASALNLELRIEQPDLWWPHTHGEPALYSARLLVRSDSGAQIEADLGRIGFRRIDLTTEEGGFRIRVNGVPVFCRGACWTPLDCVSLSARPEEYRHALMQVKAAGMNMLRISGTMVYEDDAFLDECDAQGILLWQEFMFANMDYPDDAAFEASVTLEARHQLGRLAGRPCIAVICGNSEVEQQAAMWGATRDRWQPRLFHEVLPSLTQATLPDVPYWPSSAHGGAFPHQNDVGTTSYYGVGAYQRPLEDARRSAVRFATECLAFANVPEMQCIERMPGGHTLKVHHPTWKTRTPRDLGAGWDFEDVRDFYLKTLFCVDPAQLRYADHDRYLHLSRMVTGEVMHCAFAEWRADHSVCGGALVWFLRDLWPGAGWGIIDACGEPKAAYHYLRRALQPRVLFLSDEGTNGLGIHLVNDAATAVHGTLSLTLYRHGNAVVSRGMANVTVPARAARKLNALTLFEGFYDLSYAYRFGPLSYEVAVATFAIDGSSEPLYAFHLPAGLAPVQRTELQLSATAEAAGDGSYRLQLRAQGFAQAVTVQADGYACEDQYFHLAPDSERTLRLSPSGAPKSLRGSVHAANAASAINIEIR